MNLNQLTGADLMAARIHIGLSISATAKLTGVNRNTLSQFEQEKATLTNIEKKRLVGCYEDRGYDFNEPQLADDKLLAQRYDGAQEQLTEVASNSQVPSGLGEAILALADASHDLMANALRPANESAGLGLEDLETIELPDAYLEMHETLQRHFEADSVGGNQSKVGFFKEDADERSAKLIAYMARQYMTILHADMPDVVSLEREKLNDDSDNARVLDTLNRWLEYEALEELNEQ